MIHTSVRIGQFTFWRFGLVIVEPSRFVAIQWKEQHGQFAVIVNGGKELLTGIEDKSLLESLMPKPKPTKEEKAKKPPSNKDAVVPEKDLEG